MGSCICGVETMENFQQTMENFQETMEKFQETMENCQDVITSSVETLESHVGDSKYSDEHQTPYTTVARETAELLVQEGCEADVRSTSGQCMARVGYGQNLRPSEGMQEQKMSGPQLRAGPIVAQGAVYGRACQSSHDGLVLHPGVQSVRPQSVRRL